MQDEPLVLSPDGEHLVMVHRAVVERIKARTEKGFSSREAGGILLGSYRGKHIEIFGCTEPMKSDFRTKILFDRKDPGHQAAASSAWKGSGGTDTFVGEWHTHPEPVPSPSWLDRTTWKSQLKRLRMPLVFAIGGWEEIYWCFGERTRLQEMTSVY